MMRGFEPVAGLDLSGAPAHGRDLMRRGTIVLRHGFRRFGPTL